MTPAKTVADNAADSTADSAAETAVALTASADFGQPEPAPPTLASLGLSPTLVRRAAEAGWARATPIQAAALPLVLQGRDVLGVAPTGSGKTAAFLLPLLQRLLAVPADERPRRLRGLVLAPTRELALQTGEIAKNLAPELRTVLAVGGVSINPQMMALRGGAHLVVATPGRLLELVAQRALKLSHVSVLVLDEADRLLDLGFADELGPLLALLPQQRQTLLFTATMPEAVAVLAERLLNDPLRVQAAAAPEAAPVAIRQRAIEVDTAQRTPLLRHLIATEGWSRVLVFVATQYATEHVAEKLHRAGISAAAWHGQLKPGRRREVLADFRAGRLTVLVATDLAARGLDIVDLLVVVNHELPRSAVDYVHRIGRTGRAGAAGLAVSFIAADAPGSEAHFRLIERRQDQRVPREQVPGFEPQPPLDMPPPADPAGGLTGGLKGRRKSKKDKLREAAAAPRR